MYQQVPAWGRLRARDSAQSLSTLLGCCQLTLHALGSPFWLLGHHPHGLLGACVASQPTGDGESSTRWTEVFPRGSREGARKQEREMEDSPQKPPGWEKIWSWGANMGSSSCSLPCSTAWLLHPCAWTHRPKFLLSPVEKGDSINTVKKETKPKHTKKHNQKAQQHVNPPSEHPVR